MELTQQKNAYQSLAEINLIQKAEKAKVDKEMQGIEFKISNAKEKKMRNLQSMLKSVDRLHYRSEANTEKKSAMTEKREYDTLSKVVLKHRDKELYLKKKNREKKELFDFEMQKKEDKNEDFKRKL